MADAGKVSLRPRGRFDITATYERLDFVKYNTGCYVALQTTTGNLPTDTTNFMNLIDFDIANMSQIGLVKPDGESTTIDSDGTLHAHAVGSVTSFNGRTGSVLPQTSDYTAAQVAYDNTDSALSANNVKGGLDELDAEKADNSVIAPVESGATSSRAYAAGAHFIKEGAFCTAKTAIAQGETFTLNTNYTAGSIASELGTYSKALGTPVASFQGNAATSSSFGNYGCLIYKSGNIEQLSTYGQLSSPLAGTNGILFNLPVGYRPKHDLYIQGYGTYNNVTRMVGYLIDTAGNIKTMSGSSTYTGFINIEATIILN